MSRRAFVVVRCSGDAFTDMTVIFLVGHSKCAISLPLVAKKPMPELISLAEIQAIPFYKRLCVEYFVGKLSQQEASRMYGSGLTKVLRLLWHQKHGICEAIKTKNIVGEKKVKVVRARDLEWSLYFWTVSSLRFNQYLYLFHHSSNSISPSCFGKKCRLPYISAINQMIYEEESRGSYVPEKILPGRVPTEISLSRARAAIHLMISRGALVPVAAVKTERPIGQRSIKIPKDITRLPDGEIQQIAEKWRKNLHSTSYDYVSDQAELFILEWDPATTSELVTAAAVVGIPLLLWTIKFWPIWAKIWAWWVFFFVDATLIIVLATAFSVRLVIYAALWPAGIDFWFFPDLIDRDSFTPLYTVERQKIDQRGGRRYNMYNTQ